MPEWYSTQPLQPVPAFLTSQDKSWYETQYSSLPGQLPRSRSLRPDPRFAVAQIPLANAINTTYQPNANFQVQIQAVTDANLPKVTSISAQSNHVCGATNTSTPHDSHGAGSVRTKRKRSALDVAAYPAKRPTHSDAADDTQGVRRTLPKGLPSCWRCKRYRKSVRR